MNFDFFKNESRLRKLYEYCVEAEEFCLSYPNISTTSARKAMEYIVKALYKFVMPEGTATTVFEMAEEDTFKAHVDAMALSTIHFIRKMGNVAVHEGNITQEEAVSVLKNLHFLVGNFCIALNVCKEYTVFIPPQEEKCKDIKEPPEDIQKKVVVESEVQALFSERMRNTRFCVQKGRDEGENKKLFLYACLREAGWAVVNLPNQTMPCCASIDMILDDGEKVDWVLNGRDNKPLALIEYTVSSQNIVAGRMKAIALAEKMAVKYGYKPIVYYTNGYMTYIIDQLGYKPRRVFQFHSISELELLKLRANIRQDIRNPIIDESIAGRYYQKEAINACCNAFSDFRRRSLLVMATGTGKTRVSIALADVLLKNNWVKNILFLADRTSLVKQASKNFNKLLPSITTSNYIGASVNKDANARIIFSTYQTMINLINDDTREFGIGRFDLIIIDEAHRSIFKKYSALFHYFDSLMIGLTATPRVEDNKSTYQMFDLHNAQPDYAYELEKAIHDKFLVGFSVTDKTTDAMRRGVHYDELSEEEKEQFEEAFSLGEEEEKPNDYGGTVLEAKCLRSARYINLGTIDAMLNDLMKNGLRINGGDKIGKTIIFSQSHIEAEKIVERFNRLYAHLGADFCKVIDSKVENNQNLIENFEIRDSLPQIVVSVDMMDTGIDVPDILNLVFFKPVGSKIKFLQMIGRGTRLSENIFGPEMDKKGFLIFDYYDNFNFFRTHNTWSTVEGMNGKSNSIVPQNDLINQRKLSILRALSNGAVITKFEIDYKEELRKEFLDGVRNLCNDDIEVQYNMAYVNKYRTEEQWYDFSDEKIREIEKHIIPLLYPYDDPVKVKTFDLMIYVIEDEVPKRAAQDKDVRKIKHGFGNIGNKIDLMMTELLKLKTIPDVVKKEKEILSMRHADYLFEEFTIEKCEKTRRSLRNLMQYIPDNRAYYILNIRDFVISAEEANDGVYREKSYREKATEFIEKGDIALSKLRNLDPLTPEEKASMETVFKQTLGTESDYLNWSGGKALLPFLRMQVGISEQAIQTKFGSFLNKTVLTERQYLCMEQILQYACVNGDITFMDLQKVSPFCDIDFMAEFGVNFPFVKELINGLHKPVQ